MMDYYPLVERGAWEQPVYYELLRRGLSWAKDRLEPGEMPPEPDIRIGNRTKTRA
ncbi:hypothetical protein D3C76_1385160 [compost metagenome]